MKKRYLVFTILLSAAVLSLSSCLKDKNYIDFSKVGTTVNFPLGGLAHFSGDAITDGGDTIVKQFAVNVASPNVPTTATTLTLAIDNTVIAPYNTANPAVTYDELPADAFVFTATSVVVPAGQQYATVSVTFYKSKLDPSKSYMLPIKIVKSTNGTISSNFNIHYFHFIGNDFAGTYHHFYTRYEVGDTTTTAPSSNAVPVDDVTFSPVTPTEFVMPTGYYSQPNYDVTFTKTGIGAAAMYSDFAVRFLPADIAAGTQWATGGITVAISPKIVTTGFTPGGSYTFADAQKLFRIYFTTVSRGIIDQYKKP